jgi:LuxR family maltose regulon positive regulatory protein
VLVPQLQEAKRQVIQSGSHFATIRIMQWLAIAAIEAGRLRLAYAESQAALDQIEQIGGYTLLQGYFAIVQAKGLYQWNRLQEARNMLQMAIHGAATWQHLDVLGWGYVELMQVELASGAWSAAQQALYEVEHIVQREGYGIYPSYLPLIRARLWLAQGQMKQASDWAESIVFPEGTWENLLYDAFAVVIAIYFAQRRWREALDLLEHWRDHLDRPANIAITITYLAQLLVARHQAGKAEHVPEIAERLFALTEPEGYLRVYLDEGEPMRQALQGLLAATSELAPSTTTYIAKLLAAFALEKPDALGVAPVAPTYTALSPALSPAQQPSPAADAFTAPLTRREQEVLFLLATGASNQNIAQTLVISLTTVKKHVSNLLGKLGAANRTQAIIQARNRSLL